MALFSWTGAIASRPSAKTATDLIHLPRRCLAGAFSFHLETSVNDTQRQCGWFAVLIILAMTVYPPWVRVHTRPESPLQTPQGLTINVAVHAPETASDYDWLFSSQHGKVDLVRLGMQYLAVALFFGWCIYLCHGPEAKPAREKAPRQSADAP